MLGTSIEASNCGKLVPIISSTLRTRVPEHQEIPLGDVYLLLNGPINNFTE